MCEKVNIADAAKELGVSIPCVRMHMRRNIWDLGEAVNPKRSGKSLWEYHIYRAKLDRHLGREVAGH